MAHSMAIITELTAAAATAAAAALMTNTWTVTLLLTCLAN